VPPSPPVVTNNGGATDVTSNSARLRGEVTSTGNENPTVTVYWGDNDGVEDPGSWDYSSAPTSPSQPQGAVTFYKDVTSLNPDTDYYYRCYAENSAGSDWADTTVLFHTPAPPPPPNAPSNLTATPISSSQINLTWQDNSGDETGFEIERKTGSGSYSQIATVGAGVTSYSNTALSASTTYYYRVRAYNAAGNSGYSNEASATTPLPPLVYCSCGGTTYSMEWVSGVQFNTIDKSSGGNGYADYTSISTNVVRGSTYALIVTIGQTGSWQEYVKAYFDWNQDGDFEDAGEGIEIGHCSSNGCIVSANINIPGTATLGSTRMRIVLQYNSYHGPCGSYTYGDTEDYSVIIQI
jgi:hypothetical protein